MALIVGADPAINHGAIVDVNGRIIYTYDNGKGMKSSMEDLYQLSMNAASSLPMGCILVMDWDRTVTSWGRDPRVGTLMTIIAVGLGYIARLTRKANVKFVSPSAIRHCLDLPAKASKATVHKAYKDILPPSLRGKFHKSADVRGDCIDAYILCNTYVCTSAINK